MSSSVKVFGDESLEIKLEDVKLSDLGQVGEVVITKDDTLFMRGESACNSLLCQQYYL
jgi:chaperonin GroEL